MKNITVSVDDATYKRARVKAAEAETSVSAMVRDFLNGLETAEGRFDRLKRQELVVREQIVGFSASDNISRDALHERHR